MRSIDKLGPLPSPEMQRWYVWIQMWEAIGDEVFTRSHRCPSCDSGPFVHWKECAIYDTHCIWCYQPRSKNHHETWCRRPCP